MRLIEFGPISPEVAKVFTDGGFLPSMVPPRFGYLAQVVSSLDDPKRQRVFEATVTKAMAAAAKILIQAEFKYASGAGHYQLMEAARREVRDVFSIGAQNDRLFDQHYMGGLTDRISRAGAYINPLLKGCVETYDRDPKNGQDAVRAFFSFYNDIAPIDTLLMTTNTAQVLKMLAVARAEKMYEIYASGINAAARDKRLVSQLKPFELNVIAVDLADGNMIAYLSDKANFSYYTLRRSQDDIMNIRTEVSLGLMSKHSFSNREAINLLRATDKILHEQPYRLGEIAGVLPSDLFPGMEAERKTWDAHLQAMFPVGGELETKYRDRLPLRVRRLLEQPEPIEPKHQERLAHAEKTIVKVEETLAQKPGGGAAPVMPASGAYSVSVTSIGQLYVSARSAPNRRAGVSIRGFHAGQRKVFGPPPPSQDEPEKFGPPPPPRADMSTIMKLALRKANRRRHP